MVNQRTFRITAATLLPCLALLAGCRALMMPLVVFGAEPTRKVAAEYPYLADKTICIAVWLDNNTRFEYPHAQLELSEHVAAALQPHIDNVAFVPNKRVVAYQRSHPNWDREDPAVLGARFRADRLMLIEVTQYTTREPDSPHLYRGRIAASVKVYDTEYENAAPVYRTRVEVAYPPKSVGEWGADDRSIRRGAMELFAAELARKFYDHRVKVE
ncbi:MAG: hypothetical protein D6744_08970 [Planctomycetota bacterium]|nr:MAG: hypothetical protein D6744_08970 [Planctomycetota bacterium]